MLNSFLLQTSISWNAQLKFMIFLWPIRSLKSTMFFLPRLSSQSIRSLTEKLKRFANAAVLRVWDAQPPGKKNIAVDSLPFRFRLDERGRFVEGELQGAHVCCYDVQGNYAIDLDVPRIKGDLNALYSVATEQTFGMLIQSVESAMIFLKALNLCGGSSTNDSSIVSFTNLAMDDIQILIKQPHPISVMLKGLSVDTS